MRTTGASSISEAAMSSPVSPLKLTDDQLASVMRIAEPLHPHDRAAFLILLASRLRGVGVLGDGIVSRVARETVREFWRAPQVEQHDPRHEGKYAR
jgi:hypothetical protein